MLGRKELFKNTLRKAAHAWRKIIELRLNGEVVDHFLSFAFGFQFFFSDKKPICFQMHFLFVMLL